MLEIWKAQRTLQKTKGWDRVPKQNYLPMKLLMDAELASVKGKKKLANEKYNAASEMATRSGYRMVEAMAHEHAGRHLFRTGDTTMATTSFKKAVSCYQGWGARAKVQHLQSELKQWYAAKGIPLPSL
jgi:predicted negative regulator of RcsB-dependent stress response